jgi:hypothetical protein
MLSNLSNAALLGILWVKNVSTKSGFDNILGIPIANVSRGRLESFSGIPD